MAIRYVSKHDSPDDPGGLIHEALAAGEAFPGPAEDLLLAWSLRLDQARDPKVAASRMLEAHGLAAGPLPEGAVGRLVELLREAAAAGLGPLGDKPRRRGGRSGRGGRSQAAD